MFGAIIAVTLFFVNIRSGFDNSIFLRSYEVRENRFEWDNWWPVLLNAFCCWLSLHMAYLVVNDNFSISK